jgi:serine/threonine protein kinase
LATLESREPVRRYRITGFLGEGGFGEVFQAELLGARGFRKQVAIKLLRKHGLPDDVIPRFHDEARILGMARDRAIVQVDPPVQLDGRWAIVMEYVEGASAAALANRGPFPPRVVAEIGAEVGRVMDRLYNAPGPDGVPLHLVHRDIKPANLHITRDGDVKLLDFGIARARFDTREARTTTELPGTPGYMPPERLQGKDGPFADVFALGVTLRALLTTERPGDDGPRYRIESTPQIRRVLAMCEAMTQVEYERRPDWPAVRRWCDEIAKAVGGQGLKEWAPRVVPQNTILDTGAPQVGQILTDATSVPAPPRKVASRRTAWWAWGLGAAGVMIGFGGLAFGAVALLFAQPWAADEEAPLEAQIEPIEAPPPPPAPEPLPPEPAPIAPAPIHIASPRPVVVIDRPQAPLAAIEMTFTSDPLGAALFIDGERIDETPCHVPVFEGKHRVELRHEDGQSVSKTVRVSPGQPTRYKWSGGDAWGPY